MFNSNTRNLIFKDFRISLHPSVYVFFLLAPAMLFIPNYLRAIGFFYILIGLMNMFTLDLQYKDKEFCGLLPVKKNECVKARVFSVCILEIGLMLLSVPFAFLAQKYVHSVSNVPNNAGMNINVCMYAIMLLGYAVTNVILIPAGYRKHFRAFLRGFISMFAFMLVAGSLEQVVCRIQDGKFFLNGVSFGENLRQLPYLAGAIVIYALVNLYTYYVSAKSFEKADI